MAGQPDGSWLESWQVQQSFLFAETSRPAVGSTHPPLQRYRVFPSVGSKATVDERPTNHLHQVPGYRMSGAGSLPLLLLYAFMACVWTALPLPL